MTTFNSSLTPFLAFFGLDDAACARHPYQKHAFPSLWDSRWVAELTKGERPIVAPAPGAPS